MAKQQDGRYRAKVTVGKDMSGKSVVKYVSGRTKKELESAKEAVRQEYITGQSASKDALFGPYAIQWYNAYKKPTIKESAQSGYKTALNKHILPVLGDRRLTAISAMDLQELLNSKGNTCVTIIENVYHVLESVFKCAYTEGIIPRDVTVGLVKPSKEKESRRALTDAETEAAKVLMHQEGGLIIALLYYTGMRIGEALGLQWEHVDFKEKRIWIKQQAHAKTHSISAPKTDESIRYVPMPTELMDMLLPLRGVPKAYVYPGPGGSFWPATSAYRLWGTLMMRLYEIDPSIEVKPGTENMSILTPHYFRHNYASILYNAGVDVLSAQKFLGHANVKVTLEIYSHLSKEKQDESAGAVMDAFKKRLPKSCQDDLLK